MRFRLCFFQFRNIDHFLFVQLWCFFASRSFPQHCIFFAFCSFSRFMFDMTVCFQMIKSRRWSSCFSCRFAVLLFVFTCWKIISVVCVVNWVHKTVLIKISEQDCTIFQPKYDFQKNFKVRQELDNFVHLQSVHRTDFSILFWDEPNLNYSPFKMLWIFNHLVG